MTTLNLNHFCDPEEKRLHCRQPFNWNGKTVATNGHIVVFAPEQPLADLYELTPNLCPTNLLDLYEKTHAAEFVPMPPGLPIETIKCDFCNRTGKCTTNTCDECDGDGEIVFHTKYHRYDWDCESCSGEGIIYKPGGDIDCHFCYGKGNHPVFMSSQPIIGVPIQNRYLTLIMDLPDLFIAAVDMHERKALAFKNLTYSGMIMPLVF